MKPIFGSEAIPTDPFSVINTIPKQQFTSIVKSIELNNENRYRLMKLTGHVRGMPSYITFISTGTYGNDKGT